MGIERGNNWIPIPKAHEKIEKEDRLVVYGPHPVLKKLLKVPTDLHRKQQESL